MELEVEVLVRAGGTVETVGAAAHGAVDDATDAAKQTGRAAAVGRVVGGGGAVVAAIVP